MYKESKITYNDFDDTAEIFNALINIQNETKNEELKNQIIQFRQFLTDIYTPSTKLNSGRTTNLIEEIVYNSSMEQVTIKCSCYRDEDSLGERILEIVLQGENIPYIITETSTYLNDAGTKESYDAMIRILSEYLANPINPIRTISSTSLVNNESNQTDGTLFVTEEQIETVVKRIVKSMLD